MSRFDWRFHWGDRVQLRDDPDSAVMLVTEFLRNGPARQKLVCEYRTDQIHVEMILGNHELMPYRGE